MWEIVPVAGGIVIGVLFGTLRPRVRWLICGAAAVLAGVLATVISGEFRISWDYLLVDIPLVALSAVSARALSILVVRKLAPSPD
jgi:hypothetical protein